MKRKLVSFDVFNEIKQTPLVDSLRELIEAEDHFARALTLDSIKLSSFNEDTALYEAVDGSYIQANYKLEEGKVKFDNIQQIVIDEQSENDHGKKILRNLLETIMDDKAAEAKSVFEDYLNFQSKSRKRESELCTESVLSESYARIYGSPERTKNKGTPKVFYRSGNKDSKKAEAAKLGHKRHQSSYKRGVSKRKRNLPEERLRRKRYKNVRNRLSALVGGKKKMNEWANLVDNVFNYIDYADNSHVLLETVVTDNSVSLPNSKARNEGKVLKLHNDNVLKTDVKILREQAKLLSRNSTFCNSVAEIKRSNNISDTPQLEESINKLIQKFPSVIYLTEDELAKTVSLSLASVGVNNYDDEICKFIAEGILRGAHHIYSERVDRIVKLANKQVNETSEDKYTDFQNIISDFYATLDETTQLEMKMYEDLYNALVEVHNFAVESKNSDVFTEAREFISELKGILEGTIAPSTEIATEVAVWLENFVEVNWDVVKDPLVSVNGDSPVLSKYAKVPGHPYSMPNQFHPHIPTISGDDKKHDHDDDEQNHSWGNKGGKDVYPDLANPYLLTPFEYKMKEKENDVEDGLGTWQDDNTVPNLKNPYLLPAFANKQLVDPKNGVE